MDPKRVVGGPRARPAARRGVGRGGRSGPGARRRSSAHRPGAERRRRPRRGPHRRHPRARGAPHPHRRRGRHQHGCRRGRALRGRHDRRRNRRGVPHARLAGPAARPRAAQGSRLSPQAGRSQLPRERRPRRPRRRRHRAAARSRAGTEDHAGAAQRDHARGGRAGLRQAADAVPGGRDRSRDRRRRGAALGRPRDRAAREHVRAGRAGAGRDRRATARGRRAGGQPPGGPCQGDGRRRGDRRGRQLPALASRRTRDTPRRLEPDDRHHGAAGHGRIAARARPRGRAGAAGAGPHDGHRFCAHAAGDDRGRDGGRGRRREARGAGGAGRRVPGLRRPARAHRRSFFPGRFRAAGRALGGRRETHRGRVRLDGGEAARHGGAAAQGLSPVRTRPVRGGGLSRRARRRRARPRDRPAAQVLGPELPAHRHEHRERLRGRDGRERRRAPADDRASIRSTASCRSTRRSAKTRC